MTLLFRRLLAGLTAAALFTTASIAGADEARESDASAHVLQAEIALHRMDYLEAAHEYRRAAELSFGDAAFHRARWATLSGY